MKILKRNETKRRKSIKRKIKKMGKTKLENKGMIKMLKKIKKMKKRKLKLKKKKKKRNRLLRKRE